MKQSCRTPECWNLEFQQVEIFADNFLILADNFDIFASKFFISVDKKMKKLHGLLEIFLYFAK